ncbi:unnamed protein product, partial [Polarella glacialis]
MAPMKAMKAAAMKAMKAMKAGDTYTIALRAKFWRRNKLRSPPEVMPADSLVSEQQDLGMVGPWGPQLQADQVGARWEGRKGPLLTEQRCLRWYPSAFHPTHTSRGTAAEMGASHKAVEEVATSLSAECDKGARCRADRPSHNLALVARCDVGPEFHLRISCSGLLPSICQEKSREEVLAGGEEDAIALLKKVRRYRLIRRFCVKQSTGKSRACDDADEGKQSALSSDASELELCAALRLAQHMTLVLDVAREAGHSPSKVEDEWESGGEDWPDAYRYTPMCPEALSRRLPMTLVSFYFDDATIQHWASSKGSGQLALRQAMTWHPLRRGKATTNVQLRRFPEIGTRPGTRSHSREGNFLGSRATSSKDLGLYQADNRLASGVASKLYGCSNFFEQGVYGKIGRAGLNSIKDRQYDKLLSLTPAIEQAFEVLEAIVRERPVRAIHLTVPPVQRFVVASDAALEIPRHGAGGRRGVWFIDNTAALMAMVRRRSDSADLDRLALMIHAAMFALEVWIYIEWVETKSNWSDGLWFGHLAYQGIQCLWFGHLAYQEIQCYIVANPSTYAYLDDFRWAYRYEADRNQFSEMNYGLDWKTVEAGAIGPYLRSHPNLKDRDVHYFVGQNDGWEGAPDPKVDPMKCYENHMHYGADVHELHVVPGSGHEGDKMLLSEAAALKIMFDCSRLPFALDAATSGGRGGRLLASLCRRTLSCEEKELAWPLALQSLPEGLDANVCNSGDLLACTLPSGCKLLWYFRHGQSTGNIAKEASLAADQRAGGTAHFDSYTACEDYVDAALTPEGHLQAELGKLRLSEWRFKPQLIVCSPLTRAIQTAALVFQDEL